MISQDKLNVTQFVKRDGNRLRFVHDDPSGMIELESLKCHLAMADIYAQVNVGLSDTANSSPS